MEWADEVCPTVKRVSSEHGQLEVATTYALPSAFQTTMACLPSHSVLVGTHSDPSLDFRHEATFARTYGGLLESVTLYDRAGNPFVSQTASYTPDGLVATLTNTGRGTSTFSYVAGSSLLQTMVSPDGVTTSVTERDPSTDAVRGLAVDRGMATAFTRSFRYDGQERLASWWHNLGGASASRPDQTLAYRYASGTSPAFVDLTTLLDASTGAVGRSAEIDSAAGEALAKAHLVPQGWAFDAVVQRSRATRTTTQLVKPTSAANVAGIDMASLYADGRTVVTTQASAFGAAVTSASQIQAGVEQDIASALSLSAGLVRTDVENGTFSTVTTADAGGRITSVVDPAGGTTRFTYDALGRARRTRLADGAVHRVEYDDYGRASRVDREGVASIVYSYDAATGLLAQRDFLGGSGSPHAGEAMRSVRYAYDGIGRLRAVTHVDVGTGATQRFTLYYDGATPAAPTAGGARGLLTGVAGPNYTKTLSYRADGAEVSRVVDIAGWRQIEIELALAEDGFTSGRTVIVRDATGKELVRDTEQVQRDAFGQAASTTRDGLPFSTFAFTRTGSPRPSRSPPLTGTERSASSSATRSRGRRAARR